MNAVVHHMLDCTGFALFRQGISLFFPCFYADFDGFQRISRRIASLLYLTVIHSSGSSANHACSKPLFPLIFPPSEVNPA
jgi:hypothetical protein